MADASRKLIEQAFEKARESGRSDWYRMTVAVLKNRLLDLTDRTFKESDYGAVTFQEFVEKHADILSLDETTTPTMAIFKGTSPEDDLAGWRIRPDLWKAALDFSGDEDYFWDAVRTQAVTATGDTALGPKIATIAAEEFGEWKRDFAASLGDSNPPDRVVEWVHHRRPAALLPSGLRHRWNGYLKERVKEHLLTWFSQQNVEPPADLLEPRDSGDRATESEHLRGRLIACLRSMTREELERVQIPASVLLRMKF